MQRNRIVRAAVFIVGASLLVPFVGGCNKEETKTTTTTGTPGSDTADSRTTGEKAKDAAKDLKNSAEGKMAEAKDATKGALADAKAAVTGAGGKTAVAEIKPSGGAATQPANKTVMGTVTFTSASDGVKVVADLTGLAPGKHGFHIHDKADMSAPDLTSAGGHWDPDAHKQHGGPASEAMQRHTGDLGNIEADASGKAHLETTIAGLTVGDGGKMDVVGHSVVVHADEDDLKSNPAGKAGYRIAGAAITAK